MYVLLTNDDGISAPALLALKQALDQVAETVIFAPDRNWSAAGHPMTMHKPLRADPLTLPDGSQGYSSNGAPSDCVALALLGHPRVTLESFSYDAYVAKARRDPVGPAPALYPELLHGR